MPPVTNAPGPLPPSKTPVLRQAVVGDLECAAAEQIGAAVADSKQVGRVRAAGLREQRRGSRIVAHKFTGGRQLAVPLRLYTPRLAAL